jgi:membrane peptidoglycan carboxypeptidase
MYFNQVSYGATAYGVEEAAQMYFGKHASDVTLSEAAFLAGIPQAPTLYSPYINPELSIKRRNEALKNMLSLRFISQNQYDEAVKSKLQVRPPLTLIRAPHFVFYVKSLLAEQYGARRVEEGGLRIYTTLDIKLQEEAEKILQSELAKVSNLNVTNGALLITSPKNGEILAMVGSSNYFEDPNGAFNVVTAKRQPGSSIKPLMYSLALEKGFTAASVIEDGPVIYKAQGSKPFIPVNYDGLYHGRVTLRSALANSYNIPAVRVLNEIGVSQFIDHATKMGITTWSDPKRFGLSLTLGGGEVMMTDMAVAFGV